jgi:hypothetical protein
LTGSSNTMSKRQNEIANVMAYGTLPTTLLILICEYDNDAWDMLQRVCQDIQILRIIPLMLNISTQSIWDIRPILPRPLYEMTSVKLRVNYINMIPSRICVYCGLFPAFRVLTRASNFGLDWPVSGCSWCCDERPLGYNTNFHEDQYEDQYEDRYEDQYEDQYEDHYNPRDEY